MNFRACTTAKATLVACRTWLEYPIKVT